MCIGFVAVSVLMSITITEGDTCAYPTHPQGKAPAESWGQAPETMTLLQRFNLF